MWSKISQMWVSFPIFHLKVNSGIVHTAAPNMQIPGALGYRRPDRTSEQNLRMCYINACIRAEENGGQRVVRLK